jgi:hypothetical protein
VRRYARSPSASQAARCARPRRFGGVAFPAAGRDRRAARIGRRIGRRRGRTGRASSRARSARAAGATLASSQRLEARRRRCLLRERLGLRSVSTARTPGDRLLLRLFGRGSAAPVRAARRCAVAESGHRRRIGIAWPSPAQITRVAAAIHASRPSAQHLGCRPCRCVRPFAGASSEGHSSPQGKGRPQASSSTSQ